MDRCSETAFEEIIPVKSFRLYRECDGARELGERYKSDRWRIPDTTTCTKPFGKAYGDWFLIC